MTTSTITLEALRNLSEGDFVVEETIDIPRLSGTKITGVGGSRYIPPKAHYRGHTSNLIWEGTDEDGAILRIAGVGTVIEKVTFIDAPIGVHLKVEKGIGTGKMALRDCFFEECGVAFQGGCEVGDHNVDNVVFNHVEARNCETLLRLKNAQAMGFSLRDCRAIGPRTKDIIDIFAGGCVYVDNLKVIHGECILRLRSRKESGGHGIGSSNGLYTLRNIKLDEHAGTCKIVQMDDHYPVNIDIENVLAPSKKWEEAIKEGNPQPMYELNGNAVISIRNSNLYKGCITWKDKKRKGADDIPNIYIDRCRFNGDDIYDVFSRQNSVGRCYFKAINCAQPNGTPIDNFSGFINV